MNNEGLGNARDGPHVDITCGPSLEMRNDPERELPLLVSVLAVNSCCSASTDQGKCCAKADEAVGI